MTQPGPEAQWTPSYGAPPLPPPPAPEARAREPWITRTDLKSAAITVAVLAVLGVAAGILWGAISPHTHAFVTSGGVIPDETEQLISGDGRFVIITGAIGIVAGLVSWFWRSCRGPVAAAALALGGTLGAFLTAFVGNQLSSGHSGGAVNVAIKLPIALNAHGLIAIEGGLALLCYLAGTLFVADDNLGRPEPQSAPTGWDMQGLDGHGDRPSGPQDGQLTS